ncbi:hypothetical protein [Stenotrophomonas rhizophila]
MTFRTTTGSQSTLMTVGTTGRVGSQTTADGNDRRGERMTRTVTAFDTGHATTERCTGYRQSIGMRPYQGRSRRYRPQ